MRLAVLADIHGNLPALEAVVADLAGQGVDAVVNLGDCVSGPLWPAETLALLRALGWPTVRGNHDRMVATRAPAALGATDTFAREMLDDAGLAWLAALPPQGTPAPGVLAMHGRPGDDESYLMENVVGGCLVVARPAEVAARLPPTPARLLLCAHSHRPGSMRLPDGRLVLNPGSVGCPAYHDPDPPAHVSEAGDPAARYALVDLDAGDPARPRCAFVALPYDDAAAARRAEACGRDDWALALSTGMAGHR